MWIIIFDPQYLNQEVNIRNEEMNHFTAVKNFLGIETFLNNIVMYAEINFEIRLFWLSAIGHIYIAFLQYVVI